MAETPLQGIYVARDEDRLGDQHSLGIGVLSFKVTTADSHGTLLAVEVVHHTPGGPPRHVHLAQDEWFYVVEGAYVIEVGDQRWRLGPGDSVFGPRQVPHGWAYVGGARGRIAFAFTPAGHLEAFFRALSTGQAMAPPDPAFWRPYAMEVVGPPVPVE
jgi:quercetin dioxygenase-like cupin family protein